MQQRWIKGIFEIPGLIHALMDVRVQLIMSEQACVFRQRSCGLKNCLLTSESQQPHMHEMLSTRDYGHWEWWLPKLTDTQISYVIQLLMQENDNHNRPINYYLSSPSREVYVCVYWLCAEGEGCTGDWGRQVESLGNLPPQFLVDNLNQTTLLCHQPVEWVQIQNLLGHNGDTVHWRS